MKRLYYSAALSILFVLPLFSTEPQKKPNGKEPPFDADLFRKEVQCSSFRAEFLYWKIQEGSLDYAQKMSSDGWGPENCYSQGHFQNATFNIDPGFRLTWSFFRAPKYWEVLTQYTRLTSRGDNQAGKPTPNGNYLTGTWPQIFTNPMASAKSALHFNYNLADLLFARVFLTNPHLKLRFFGGGVGAWMDQFWKVIYANSGNDKTKITNRWSFAGGGLRLGTAFDWYWFADIYMSGFTSFACLLGSYHNSAKQTTNFRPEPADEYNTSLPVRNARFSDVRPAFQGIFSFGPSYQKNLPHNRIEIFAGYELSAWMNLQEIFRSTSGSPQDAKETWINTGMLALQGLTTRVTFDF